MFTRVSWTGIYRSFILVLLFGEFNLSSAQERCQASSRQQKVITYYRSWFNRYSRISIINVKSCDYSTNSTVIQEGALRLSGGSNSRQGRLEVYRAEKWGTVCESASWNHEEALVACFQLGFAGYHQYCSHCEFLPTSDGPGTIWFERLQCRSSRYEWLDKCQGASFANTKCLHSQDVKLECSDELIVRLVNGGSALEGQVEYYYDGTWANVCNDSWSSNDANIVCRQLGYGVAIIPPNSAIALDFGTVSRIFHMDDLDCDSQELFLHHCKRRKFGENDCGSFGPFFGRVKKAAGVMCSAPVTASIECSTSSSSSVYIYWSMPYELQFGGRIDGYSIHYGRTSSSSYSTTYYNTASHSPSRTISELSPYTRYRFRVAVDLIPYTPYTYGSWTYCTTRREAAPSGYPLNIKALPTDSSLEIVWSPLPNGTKNGRIIGYTVCWNDNSVNATHRKYIISGLAPYTEYPVTVSAFTSAGHGPKSPVEIFRTTENVPSGPPTDIRSTPSTFSIYITWELPVSAERNGIITGYSVFVENRRIVTTNSSAFSITGLTPFTDYQLEIAAHTGKGQGPKSPSTTVKTLMSYPGPVLSFAVEAINATRVKVQWIAPQLPNGDILSYKVSYLPVSDFSDQSDFVVVTSNSTMCWLDGLRQVTKYKVSIQAINSVGLGATTVDFVKMPDADECATGEHACEHECENTDGSYVCSCRDGYLLKSDGNQCTDIDECALDTDRCEQLCKDTQGSYYCSCRDGYSLSPDDVSCLNIDECAASKRQICHPDKSLCIDSDGGYECQCNLGYERGSRNNSECTDVDECLPEGVCDHHCRNDFGTHTCRCKEGYDLQKDEISCEKTTPKTCPDLIAPPSVRVRSVLVPSQSEGVPHIRMASLTCREEYAEFPTDVDPTLQYCIDGSWTHQRQGYEIPNCESPGDPYAEVFAESPQEGIECDPDSGTGEVGLSEAVMSGDGSVEASCQPNGKKRGTGHLVLKFTFSVSVPRNCTSRSCYIGKLATLRPAITRVRNKIASGDVFIYFTETNRSVNLIPGLTLKGSKKTCGTSGSIIKNNQCYQCSPGSFLNTTTRYPLCQFCPTDTYQSERGQTECIACPEGTQTRSAGSNSSELCIGLCTPGFFSRDGLAPCTLCPVGFYQPNASSDYCFQCDYEYVTIEAGATRKSQCGCPRGTYGQQCNETCSCMNGGTCLDDGSCQCTIWWTGYECSVQANFDQTCPDNICYPGVDCLKTSGTDIICGDCPEGMDGNGINCTTRCPPRSCHPAVSCFVDENGIAHCGDCPDGYSGNGSSTCTKIPQESKSFGITFPKGFEDAEKCVIFFSSNISFDPTLDILEVGSDLNNFTDHVDINGNISHVNLSSEHTRSAIKLTVPQGRSIGVLGIVWERTTADVYMSYPYPETQPLKFIAVSVPTSEWVLQYKHKLSGFIFVIAEHDNTHVNISATVDIEVKNNDQRMDGAQTAYVLSHNTRLEILSNSDLTGTIITSNKPVAVISGHSCGNVPYNVTACDQLVEEMPPVHTWGTEFIVSTFERRSRGDYLKLVTSQETTVFLFCGRSEKVTYRIIALAHVLHFLPSGVSCFVRSSQPIVIAQFSVGSTWSDSGDPSMTVVPHLDQYQPNITFYSPEICGISGYNHYVNVYYIAQGSGTSMGRHKVMRDLNINGIEVMPDDVHRIPSRDKHSVHFVVKLLINPGVHTVSSRRGSIAALVYGANRFEFYSYSVYNPIAPTAEI